VRRGGAIALVGIVILAVALVWVWTGRAGEGAGAWATATREEFREIVEAPGSLQAAVRFDVGPPSVQDFWNYSLTWMIPEGSRVTEGQVVARFDAQSLEDRLREHEADLEKVTREKEKATRDLEIQLRQLRLDLVEARSEIEKVAVEASIPEELVPALDLARTRLREKLARKKAVFLESKIGFQKEVVASRLRLLDLKRERAGRKIEYYRESRSRFDVKAPIDGVVLYIPKPNGSRWEVGESIWMLMKILAIADMETLRVEARVLEMDAARIQAGQAAEVRVDALPGRMLPSRVEEVGRIVHETSLQDPTKVFDVYLPLDGLAEEAMRPGMSVTVAVETRRLPDSVTVPVQAVYAGPDGTFVKIVAPGKASRRQPVELGPRNRERVVVLSGLEGGERVLLGGEEAEG